MLSTRAKLPATVVALGVVSLLTDLSSEMIYPLLPLFLTTVLGAGPRALGVIEGVAESTASIVKVVSGLWSDRVGRRKPLVVAGYGVAGVVRPLVGLATVWPAVLALRFFDRLGKGLRTSPRDALIADVTPPDLLGHAYGVQRAFDHAGAVLGPLVAAGLLALSGVSLRHVFFLAAVPAALVMLVLILGVKEPSARAQGEPQASPGASVDSLEPTGRRGWGPVAERDVGPHEFIDDPSARAQGEPQASPGASGAASPTKRGKRVGPHELIDDPAALAGVAPSPAIAQGWRRLGPGFHLLLAAIFVFTLGNSTDAFLLLRLSSVGVSAGAVAVLWSGLHVVKMLAAYAGGRLSDRFGRRPLMVSGWLVYALSYLSFALFEQPGALIATLIAYGLYFGLTEPVERAWVAELAPPELKGAAFGYYHGAVGLAALPASLLFGAVWQGFGAKTAFLVGAAIAAGATVVLVLSPSLTKSTV